MSIKIRDKKGNLRFEVQDDGQIEEKPLTIQDEKKETPQEEK
jgi:hypothetical protein